MNVMDQSNLTEVNTAGGFDAKIYSQLVDNLPANVMVCDPATFNITYANKTSIATLREIQDLLPQGVTADNIIGQCIDVFHKNPGHQRQMLANPANLPHMAIIPLGPHMLELNISSLNNAQGSIEHLLLSWTIVTEREQLAATLRGIGASQAMIEFEMDGTILKANQNFVSALGYGNESEIQGKHHSL
ncbi:MAG: PAS domain-containing protein, partial [Rhodospirillales bacterium]|nr:PAS domain-containing protein [Rhodospirillales bacterium]